MTPGDRPNPLEALGLVEKQVNPISCVKILAG